MKVTLNHELKEHAHGFLPHAHAQKAHDVGVAHLGHQVHFTAKITLDFGRRVFLQGFDGDLGDAVVTIETKQLSFVHLRDMI